MRQHGLPDLKIANLATDGVLLKCAADCAKDILKTDPELLLPEHKDLRRKVLRMFSEIKAEGIIS